MPNAMAAITAPAHPARSSFPRFAWTDGSEPSGGDRSVAQRKVGYAVSAAYTVRIPSNNHQIPIPMHWPICDRYEWSRQSGD